MHAHSFKDEDKERLVKFLKLIKETAKFEHTATQSVEFVSNWMWVEQTLLKKINDNILEIKAVHQAPEPKKKATKKSSTGAKK